MVEAGIIPGPRIYSTGPGLGYWGYNIKSLDHEISILIVNDASNHDRPIEEKILDFTNWFNQLKVTPTIANLKHHYESIQFEICVPAIPRIGGICTLTRNSARVTGQPLMLLKYCICSELGPAN